MAGTRPPGLASVARPAEDGAMSSQPTFPNTDELLANNARYVEQFADEALSLRPRRRLAIVACMDSRMDIFQMLGLEHGDGGHAHGRGRRQARPTQQQRCRGVDDIGPKRLQRLQHTRHGQPHAEPEAPDVDRRDPDDIGRAVPWFARTGRDDECGVASRLEVLDDSEHRVRHPVHGREERLGDDGDTEHRASVACGQIGHVHRILLRRKLLGSRQARRPTPTIENDAPVTALVQARCAGANAMTLAAPTLNASWWPTS